MQLTSGSVHHSTDAHCYELLVDAITDYAIYMLDPEGFITIWNTGAETVKGYSRRRDHRTAFLTIFYSRGSSERNPGRPIGGCSQ